MFPSFLLFLLPALQSPSPSAPKPKDPVLAARIEQLLHIVLNTTDEKEDAAAKAEVREIFARKGLPTVFDVGDSASYDFVLLGIYEQSPEFEAQVLAKAEEEAARHELPHDAAIFCEAHLRVNSIKKKAEARAPTNPALRDE